MAEDVTEVYLDHAKEWRWRRKASNHAIVASSNEAFESQESAIRAAVRAFGDEPQVWTKPPAQTLADGSPMPTAPPPDSE